VKETWAVGLVAIAIALWAGAPPLVVFIGAMAMMWLIVGALAVELWRRSRDRSN
jgi:ABC-type uncharacterized transport system permease subunit